MNNKTKLELTWIGKENRPRLEPRILVEDPEKSYHAKHKVTENDIFDNRLIFGDNLLALKALEQEFAGKVKCIYIDPPYNTGNAFEHYDDGLEHSIWLGLMRDRLEVLSRLLQPDGVIVVQIDRQESAYLKVLMDEVFSRSSYVTTIAVKMSGTTGFKIEHTEKTIVKNTEYIHIYSRSLNLVERSFEEALDFDSHYSLFVSNVNGVLHFSRLVDVPKVREQLSTFLLPTSNSSLTPLYARSEAHREWVAANAKSICRSHTAPTSAKHEWESGTLLVNQSGSSTLVNERQYSGTSYMLRRTRDGVDQLIPLSLKMNLVDRTGTKDKLRLTNILGDWWDGFHLDMGNVENEGDVEFKNGKKPERLLRRIFKMFTSPGDLVLDSFLGSGTTAAVAHKMGRRWVGIELGEHCHTHCIPRLQKVINGEDSGGVTNAVGWKGGGGFRYYKLGPSLIDMDEWGNPIINRSLNPAMLAEAMCKMKGFSFDPSPEIYWQQGRSSETDYIYVTTQTLNRPMLDKLSEDVGPNRSLLVCCGAFNVAPDAFPNLTISKIPKEVLNKCEYGRDDYSLEIRNLPDAPKPADDPPPRPHKKFGKKAADPKQPDLFNLDPNTTKEAE